MALPIVVYIPQSAMDALVGSVIFIVRPNGVRVAIDNGIYWSALNLDACFSQFNHSKDKPVLRPGESHEGVGRKKNGLQC